MDLLMILALSSALPLLLFFILHKKINFFSRKLDDHDHRLIPGPRGLPLIGILHQFDTTTPHIYLWKLSQKYGPLMSLKLGSLPILVVSSAKMAKEILKYHDLVFCSRPPLVGHRKLSYDGLDIALSPYNAEWREMRKICVLHLLSAKSVQSFRPIREDEVLRMMEKISSLKVVNLSQIVLSFTSTMICRIAFGKRYDEGDHERRRFIQLLHDTQAAFVGFYFSDFFPAIGWLDRLAGSFSRLDKIFNECDSFYQELIDEHMDPRRPDSMDGDIIDLMLQLCQDNSVISHVDITMEHIKAMLMNVFIAGSDASASTIIWAMTALMQNPEKMAKAQSEIRDIFGKDKYPLLLNEDDLGKLPYLRAVARETLRLYPAGPLLVPRYAMEDCVINGFKIQSNTTVYVNAWAIARDPENWEDPEEFLPERFLDGENMVIDGKGQDFEYIPFGAGRRGCPGYSLGIMTVEAVLANLLHLFHWELPNGMKKEDIDFQVLPGFVMRKKIDLELVAKRT